MTLFSTSKVWLLAQRDDDLRSFLTWTKMSTIHFTGIRKRVLKLWKRPFWFPKKINMTFSSSWSLPYQGGCSQFLTSSKMFFFTLRTALSAIPFVFDLCDVDVQWFPGKIFTNCARISRNCHCKWLLDSFFAPKTFSSFFVFQSQFLFCKDVVWSIRLLSFCTTTASMIVSRFAIVTEDFVICFHQVTKIFSESFYGSAIASSAWGPWNFGSFTGPKDFSWEKLEWESPCRNFITHC